MIDHDSVCDIVHQGHQEDQDDQSKEKNVVCFSDAVVKPSAVMIKAIDAAVAGTAMLRTIRYVCVADFALEIVIRAVEDTPLTKSIRIKNKFNEKTR